MSSSAHMSSDKLPKRQVKVHVRKLPVRIEEPPPSTITTTTTTYPRLNGTPTHIRTGSGGPLPSVVVSAAGPSTGPPSSGHSAPTSAPPTGPTTGLISAASMAGGPLRSSVSAPTLPPLVVSSSTSSSSFAPPAASPTHRRPSPPRRSSTDKEDILSYLARGQLFEKYEIVSGECKKSTIFLIYKGSERSHVLTWRTCTVTQPSAGQLLTAVPTGPPQSFPVQSISQLLLGKRARAFMVGVGAEAPDAHCFSLCSDFVLNLEAPSESIRTRWCKGIHRIMLQTGRKYSMNNYTPPRPPREGKAASVTVSDTIRELSALMSQGNLFVKYDLDPVTRSLRKSKVLLWLGSKKGGRESPSSSRDPARVLYWCDADQLSHEAGGDRTRLQSSSNSMPLAMITDIYHGKQTAAFSALHDVEAVRCFSFAAGSHTLNLVADSGRQRDLWVKGIHMLLKGAGKQVQRDDTYLRKEEMRRASKYTEQHLLGLPSVRMMITGGIFRQYKLLQLPQPEDAPIDAEPPVELRISDVMVSYKVLSEGQPGMFYWEETDPETSSVIPDCMPLDRITDIFLGKRAKAFQHRLAASADPQCCFSFVVSKTQVLNLETMSKQQRMHWLHGIQKLLEFYGNAQNTSKGLDEKRPLEEKAAGPPASSRRSSLPPASASVSASAQPVSVGRDRQPSSQIHLQAERERTAVRTPSPKDSGKSSKSTMELLTELTSTSIPSSSSSLSTSGGSSSDTGSPGKDKKPDEDPQKVFTILSKIGEGAYGSVFKARDNRVDELVAVKVLRLDRKNFRLLKQEIRVLAQCDSPYVVAYKGTYKHDSSVWIVMEYCDSGSLSDMLEECQVTLNEAQIAAVMKMALQGLDYIHSTRKIHRDLKAANILVTTQGDCKLADFGVSAEMKNTLAVRKTAIGTPHWMAPEVINAHMRYNTKADIWSLGITAYELAVGEPPHSDVTQMRAIFLIPTAPPPTLPNPEKWSKRFKDFLALCLQKNPQSRPDAATLLKDPFIQNAGGKEVIAELVRECQIKRTQRKKENLRTLTMRLQTERGPLDADGKSETVLRRPTELQDGEPNFEDTTRKITAKHHDEEELYQIVYS